MPIIHILGASGSGTSTLGHALHEQFHYLQLDTDDYFWLPTNPPFTQKRPIEDRLSLLNQDILKSKKIVISGSLCGWGDVLIPTFDLVIHLLVPTEIRIHRLKERESKRFGERICENGDMYEEHQAFLQWASKYDTGDTSTRSKAMHDAWLSNVPCKQICCDGTAPLGQIMQEISMNFSL